MSYIGILAAAKLAKGKQDPAYIAALTKLADAQEAKRRDARPAHVSVRTATGNVEWLERRTQRLADAVAPLPLAVALLHAVAHCGWE